MPRRSCLAILVLSLAASGCGTMANVTASSTTPGGYRAFGPTWCEPFGGVQRSVLAGSAPLMAGPVGILPAAVMVGVDTPLSLVGDVVTLPYVHYRIQNESRPTASSVEPAREAAPPPVSRERLGS